MADNAFDIMDSSRKIMTSVLDMLVTVTGLVLLFLGVLGMFRGHPNAVAYLLAGGLLLVADAGVTTRLRVGRLERQIREDSDLDVS